VTFQEFFEANRILFYSLYGQVFFVLGLAIALSARQDTKVPLARSLWLLSAFGFLHAFYEWSYVILPVQKGYLAAEKFRFLEISQRPLESLSFFFLLQFGVEVVRLSRSLRWLRQLPALILLSWLAGYFYALPPAPEENFRPYSNLADLWARYLLCFPGASLAAYGLLLQIRQAKEMGVQQIEGHLRGAALSFLLYGVVAGVLVPPASFFPASWLNRRLLASYLGLPPPVARMLAGILITYFMIRSLNIFELELRRVLEGVARARALAQDRERISRELHDGIVQALYGAGLNLENAMQKLPQDSHSAKELIRQAVHSLNRCMQEIRNYIFDLNWKEEMDYEAELRDLVEGMAGRDSLQAHFDVVGSRPKDLPSGVALHLYHFLQEASANVSRHAQATQVRVTLAYGEDVLKISVDDNGVGFGLEGVRKDATPWQQGLRNMRRRAELLGGRVEIETGPGKGTKVNLTVPLGDDGR